ncbi:DNA-nicking Smr family endonuclease [Phyllobacterium sp. 1468]|uniref:Smr/MutS family protein n=1 Tax=Phyllobacterium sp. 1468 TaxID=2817759 RepID=UPI002865D448|nr:Smr/MutS family protein [Phyllobacterium sp. 1468]MDR6631783.1 DNA-nicking Smr family endonuclease [Phyllobacterium sp. 1468]
MKKAVTDEFATLEDRILWETVAKTARPLKGKEKPTFLIDEKKKQVSMHPSASENPKPLAAAAGAKPAPAHRLHPIDRPTHKKIAKGRVVIEARIDLHGLTQSQAYGLLLGFLQRAHLRKLRHVLVITGKGSSLGSDGVLRQAVPMWFTTPSFRILVNGYEDAARNHGGTGAIYVRMRRPQEAP